MSFLPAEGPTPWDAFSGFVASVYESWHVLINVVAIIAAAFFLRWLILLILRRSIERVVSGVKKTHNVQETQ